MSGRPASRWARALTISTSGSSPAPRSVGRHPDRLLRTQSPPERYDMPVLGERIVGVIATAGRDARAPGIVPAGREDGTEAGRAKAVIGRGRNRSLEPLGRFSGRSRRRSSSPFAAIATGSSGRRPQGRRRRPTAHRDRPRKRSPTAASYWSAASSLPSSVRRCGRARDGGIRRSAPRLTAERSGPSASAVRPASRGPCPR